MAQSVLSESESEPGFDMKNVSVGPHKLRWDDLHVFVAVAEAGTISGASRNLAINHSTVLRHIGALEDALAVRLFDRLPSGYALTAPGQRLAERLSGVREQIDSSHRELMGQDEAIRGVVRLTTTDTMIAYGLMPLIAEFRVLHPAVQIQVVVNNNFMSLTKREADVAIRGSNSPPDNLIGRRVGRIQTALYASRSYRAGLPAKVSHADADWVALDESLGHLEQARWVAKHIPESRVAVRVDSLVAMVDAVDSGIGVGMLLCPLADARPQLIRLEPPIAAFDTDIWILVHPDLRQVARVRVFTQFVAQRMASDPRLVHVE